MIFWLGCGVESLRAAPWLRQREIHYWGDLDTHGFAILSQLRVCFPDVSPLLMDRETLLGCRSAWGQEPPGKRFTTEPENLAAAELELFLDLRDDRLGERLRLEQERIPFDRVQAALRALD